MIFLLFFIMKRLTKVKALGLRRHRQFLPPLNLPFLKVFLILLSNSSTEKRRSSIDSTCILCYDILQMVNLLEKDLE